MHELKGSSQDAEAEERQTNEGQVPFDESNLPDGITAIAVPDPNDPSIIVMQVGNTLNTCIPLVLCSLQALTSRHLQSCFVSA